MLYVVPFMHYSTQCNFFASLEPHLPYILLKTFSAEENYFGLHLQLDKNMCFRETVPVFLLIKFN